MSSTGVQVHALVTLGLLLLSALAAAQNCEPTQRPLCKEGVEVPSSRFNSTLRLKRLREKMNLSTLKVDWYLETGLNRMLSAPQPSEKFRNWISGFTGSNGQVLVTQTDAYLFTDSRYTLQADQELDCTWKFFDSLSASDWVAACNSTSATVKLGLDSRQIRASEFARLDNPNVTLEPLQTNPIEELWDQDGDRPKPSPQVIYPLGSKYTGKTWQAKVAQTREAMTKEGADILAVTGLDETAYLLNLRATVLANLPYFPSAVLLSATDVHVFVSDKNELLKNETLRKHLNISKEDGSCEAGQQCPKVYSLTDLNSVAKGMWRNGSKVWLDVSACSYLTKLAFADYALLQKSTPLQLAKSVKNSAEQTAYTECSLRDSAALVAFLSELQKRVTSGQQMTEITASNLLVTYREKLADFRGLSFDTIAASGPHAAIVHYRPSAATDRPITLRDVFLLDSGGQYLGCTTDVTRTMHYGSDPQPEVRDAYTRVLMGVIDLFNLTWAERLHTRNIDPFARHNLWAVRKDYGHGTGHGIGLFLSVHESPNGIGRDVTLQEGNFQSIEPGYYQREANGVLGFGIRLETISGVTRLDPTYLRFHPVTWVPFERKLIKQELLSSDQLRWLNWYHAECRVRLTPELKSLGELDNSAAWLTAATEPIQQGVKSGLSLVHSSAALVVCVLATVLLRLGLSL